MSFNVKRLKELRTSLRYSQAGLAKAAGIPVATIAAIEAGNSKNPRYATVAQLAKALGVKPDELFFDQIA